MAGKTIAVLGGYGYCMLEAGGGQGCAAVPRRLLLPLGRAPSGFGSSPERRDTVMASYTEVVLPRLCDLPMRNRQLLPYRKRIAGSARGRVLEIGAGSGLNLPFYGPVREILALEPVPRLIAMARRSAGAPVPVTFIEGSAEAIPIDDGAVDTVVTTWTLCSIPDAGVALHEMRRVLRPGGRLVFVEHGLAPEEHVRRWQDRLTPLKAALFPYKPRPLSRPPRRRASHDRVYDPVIPGKSMDERISWGTTGPSVQTKR